MTVEEAIAKLKTYRNPKEPVFILRGSDPHAYSAMWEWLWSAKRGLVGENKLAGALAVALEMAKWEPKKTPD